MLYLSYLLCLLLLMHKVSLLFRDLHKPILVLQELFEVSSLCFLASFPSVDVRSKDTPFNFFEGLLLSHLTQFLVLLLLELLYFGVKVIPVRSCTKHKLIHWLNMCKLLKSGLTSRLDWCWCWIDLKSYGSEGAPPFGKRLATCFPP